MSQAAKARRAFNSATPSSSPSTANSTSTSQAGLTLPQVISVIDNRLLNLETFMKEEKAKASRFEPSREESRGEAVSASVFDEFNHRTTLLAEEVANLKDIVLKLQAYTMDVNKMLYEERIHVLSDLGELGPESEKSENTSENADNAEGVVDA